MAALNQFSERLHTARKHSMALAAKLAQSDRLAALGRMSAGLAHEIRNPIAAMRLRAENALARAASDDPRQRGALIAIVEQIDRLDTLLASMLAMTQPFRFEPRPVGLSKWAEERLSGLGERAAVASIELRAHIEASEWVFDPIQLARAIDNLLLNALQHTPAGGTITLAIKAHARSLIIRVSDTGNGIAPDIRGRLFEPFASARAEGTGLGLALAREIASLHGGSVRALEVEHGACLEIELPWRKS